MHRLFVSKLPKDIPASDMEVFLRDLFPGATHIQLLHGSHRGEHKGHAYVHFADEAGVTAALEQLNADPPPVLHNTSIQIKRASRVDVAEGDVMSPLPLPPQLAHCVYSNCICVPSSSTASLDGVVARCNLPGGVTVVALQTEEHAVAAHRVVEGSVKCLPPLLPELLSPGVVGKHEHGEEAKRLNATNSGGIHDVMGGGDWVAAYEQQGFVPLSPAQALQLVKDLMDGRGRVAVRDGTGNVAVLSLPTHVSLLE